MKKIQVGIPTNWRKITSISIGGLIGIGFSKEKEHLLLVVSHQGRGVINCNTGEKIARNRESYGEWHNELELWCQGIGILEDEIISLAGLYGGGLPIVNSYGEGLSLIAPNFPVFDVIFEPEGKYACHASEYCYKLESDYDIRAFGFSHSGDIIVVATNHSITVYKRDLLEVNKST